MAGGKRPIGPSKAKGRRFSSLWSKAKLRASGPSGCCGWGAFWPGQVEGKSGKIGFDSLLPEEMPSQDAPHPLPAVRASEGRTGPAAGALPAPRTKLCQLQAGQSRCASSEEGFLRPRRPTESWAQRGAGPQGRGPWGQDRLFLIRTRCGWSESPSRGSWQFLCGSWDPGGAGEPRVPPGGWNPGLSQGGGERYL